MSKYIICIDQSTQGTKVILFDKLGKIVEKKSKTHRQIIDKNGYISHDCNEIYENVIMLIKDVVMSSGIDKNNVLGIAITNQRETSVAFDKLTGKPLANAVVWQCNRAKEICNRTKYKSYEETIVKKTGLKVSPYFPLFKYVWLLENNSIVRNKYAKDELCLGTIDSYLVYRLTNCKVFATDYTNVSRTELFNINTLKYDEDICKLFNIKLSSLPIVKSCDGDFGDTTCEFIFVKPIPILAVIGDSHAALVAQGCLEKGMVKTTYGTGSSIMMNIGEKPVISEYGLVTSIAYKIQNKLFYCLEGNINYTGAIISWLKDDLNLIIDTNETEQLAFNAKKDDDLVLVPSFSGLGAPYWNEHAKAIIVGIDRTTGKKEFVRAGLDAIAFQINDILKVMEEDIKIKISRLAVDGGPTKNKYLMQFQSDISNLDIFVSKIAELSCFGTFYIAALKLKMLDNLKLEYIEYNSKMDIKIRSKKIRNWENAIKLINK